MASDGKVFVGWAVAFPLLGVLALVAGAWAPQAAVAVLLIGCVFASVHHAETLARRLGDLLGSLVLAMAITVIETGLVLSIMLGGEQPTIARDSIFSALMIALNGVLGLCLLLGGRRHFEQNFNVGAAGSFMAVLVPLSVLTLVLPSFTLSAPGPLFTGSQLAVVAIISALLYGMFLYVQLVRHRDDFVIDHKIQSGARPSLGESLGALSFLVVGLLAVVLLAKRLAPVLEHAVVAHGFPKSVVGVVTAIIVLLPEGLTAVKAAARNNLQTALNLTLGSVLACVGLTIPVVAVVALVTGEPLYLGLEASMSMMLFATFLTLAFTLNTGRSTVLEGAVHLSIFAAFLLFSLVP